MRKENGGEWELYQEGNVMPDSDHRFMGSIAMDGQGNIALGYSVTSQYVSPSLRYVGRLASDPLGTMRHGEYPIVDGIGSSFSFRWGDYATMSVDPEDDSTFYFTGQYVNGTTWATPHRRDDVRPRRRPHSTRPRSDGCRDQMERSRRRRTT